MNGNRNLFRGQPYRRTRRGNSKGKQTDKALKEARKCRQFLSTNEDSPNSKMFDILVTKLADMQETGKFLNIISVFECL